MINQDTNQMVTELMVLMSVVVAIMMVSAIAAWIVFANWQIGSWWYLP